MELLSPEFLLRVLLAFVRIGALLVAAPVFGQKTVPVQLKVLLAMLLAYVLAGYTAGPLPPHVTEMLGFVLAVLVEAVTGLVLGYAAQFIFFAVQFAADVMGFQMGLSMAQVYNPVDGSSSNPLGSMMQYLFLLIFILIDGHLHLLQALTLSFNAVPLGGAHLEAAGVVALPIDHHQAVAAVDLDWAHRDPADRLIVALARHRRLPLITRDRVVADFHPDCRW